IVAAAELRRRREVELDVDRLGAVRGHERTEIDRRRRLRQQAVRTELERRRAADLDAVYRQVALPVEPAGAAEIELRGMRFAERIVDLQRRREVVGRGV